jgi:hypothetical protein
MSWYPTRPCKEPGCTNQVKGPRYCPEHTNDNSAKRARAARDKVRKSDDPTQRLYKVVAWKRFKDSFAAAGNVICQRIVNGVQCRHEVEVWHHLISPKVRPNLMYSYSNVVGVCRQHHPVTEGEPSENLQRISEIYVPTNFPRISL